MFNSLEDINKSDFSIGVLDGSLQNVLANTYSPEAKIITFESISDVIFAVLDNRLDGAYIETMIAESYIDSYPDLAIVLDIPYKAVEYVVGVKKDNTSLLGAVNLAIAAAREDGSLSKYIIMASEQCTELIYDGLLDSEKTEAAISKAKERIKHLFASESTVPFAEEHSFQFCIPESSIVVPVYAKITVGRSTLKPVTKDRMPLVADYPVPTVECSEPEDGFVTYSIKGKADISYYFDNDKVEKSKNAAGIESVKICTLFNPFEIYDYYTGLYLGNSEEITSCPIDGLDVYHSVIEYGENKYCISLKADGEINMTGDVKPVYADDSQSEKLFENALVMTGYASTDITIRVPENYDGLIMAFRGPNESVPDYWNIKNFECGEGFSIEEPAVHYWEGDTAKWVFIKVDDLL